MLYNVMLSIMFSILFLNLSSGENNRTTFQKDSIKSSLISNVQVHTAQPEVVPHGLVHHARQYLDRDYVWLNIPKEFYGATLIVTKNDKMTRDDVLYMQFEIDRRADIYVLYCTGLETRPVWLSEWEDTGLKLFRTWGTEGEKFQVYKKTFNSGSVLFFGNRTKGEPGGVGKCMFSVAIGSNEVKVSNLKIFRSNVVDSGLEIGAKQYLNEDDIFVELPHFLKGQTYIQLMRKENPLDPADKKYLSFDLGQDAMIYVIYDKNYTSQPDWIKEFTDTKQSVITLDHLGISKGEWLVYSKEFPKGKVSFLGTGLGKQYTIVIMPKYKL